MVERGAELNADRRITYFGVPSKISGHAPERVVCASVTHRRPSNPTLPYFVRAPFPFWTMRDRGIFNFKRALPRMVLLFYCTSLTVTDMTCSHTSFIT
jgi:hypothetical protein